MTMQPPPVSESACRARISEADASRPPTIAAEGGAVFVCRARAGLALFAAGGFSRLPASLWRRGRLGGSALDVGHALFALDLGAQVVPLADQLFPL